MSTKVNWTLSASLLLATAALAIQREVSDAEMVQQSDRIVYGRVVEFQYRYDNPNWPVMTEVRLQVESRFKGEPVATTWFTYPGGPKGDMVMEVSDTPELSLGDEGYFFLYAKAGESVPWLYGWENGAITVENGQAHSHSFANPEKTVHTVPASVVEQRILGLLDGRGR